MESINEGKRSTPHEKDGETVEPSIKRRKLEPEPKLASPDERLAAEVAANSSEERATGGNEASEATTGGTETNEATTGGTETSDAIQNPISLDEGVVDLEALEAAVIDGPEVSSKSKKAKQEEERKKMQLLVSNFSEDQLNRYEMYRRAAFPKASVKRIMQSIAGSALPPNVIIAMSGMAKVFVGEIVEEALDVCKEWEDTSPIQPKHIREAALRLKRKDGSSGSNPGGRNNFLR